MWSFPGLLFLFFMSAYPAVRIIRLLSPWFWAHAGPPVHILIRATSVVKIDNPVYMSFLVLFVLFFGIFLPVATFMKRRYRWFAKFMNIVNFTGAWYLLFASGHNLFTLDELSAKLFILSLIIGAPFALLISESSTTLSGLIALALLRIELIPLFVYDIGANIFSLIFDYIWIIAVLALIGYGYLLLRPVQGVQRTWRALASRFSRRRLIVILIGTFWLSLLYLMTVKHGAVDIYYLLLPAYHVLHGGTPLVSMMSQYGLLYLAPWVLWLWIFPNLPISYLAGTVLSTMLLCVYYFFLVRVGSRLYKHRFVFVLTMIASFYFTILIRYYGFPDPVSLVASPSFTPLRFGFFIVPMWFLLLYIRNSERRYFSYFLIASGLCFYYSFEIGATIVAGGALIAAIDAASKKGSVIQTAVNHALILIRSVLALGILITLLIFMKSGHLPDWGLYSFFSRLFGLGYLTLPLQGQTVLFAPVAMGLFGGLFGLWRLFGKKKIDGLLFSYLGFMTLALMPYYMGRSIPATLYNVSLPFILLSGLLLEWCLEEFRKGGRSLALRIMTVICGFLLVIGTLRSVPILAHTVLHSAEIVDAAVSTVHRSFTVWDIKTNPSYLFLKTHLPPGCPLIAFDAEEYELLTATQAIPAYNYGFVWGFIVSREQVDQLQPANGAKRICIFVNQAYLDTNEDIVHPVYEYYWEKYGQSARFISEDSRINVRLYELPVH